MTKVTHGVLWGAMENLAHAKHISCSRMALLSDMDATAFNKSKRFDPHGRPRWPSVETLVKVLDAMNVSWVEFAMYFPTGTPDSGMHGQ